MPISAKCTIFAPLKMKAEQRRHIFSALLLAVFLPALAIASLHRHAEVCVLCYECQHHIAHPLHLDQPTDSAHECEFCHFLHTPFCVSVVLSFSALALPFVSKVALHADRAVIVAYFAASPRAPPVAAL